MENSRKYSFSDFTLTNYRSLLKIAKKNFEFILFDENDKGIKTVLWRHDIDFSIEYALKLAKIDYDENIKSTFFILLHSDFYNPLEAESSKMICQIIEMGHSIGIHLDCRFYSCSSADEIEKALHLEKEFLETIFKIKIRVFSFHNPGPFELSMDSEYYLNLINTYSKVFKNELGYCSDSNGFWRDQPLSDFLKKTTYNQIQILTHPEWWQEDIRSPKERILHLINLRAKKTLENYEKTLKKSNRLNIDW